MPAEQTLREGSLTESLARLQEQVRKDPSNAKHRVFLFQLLAVLGDWDRALTQLNVAGDLDASTLAMVQAYREAIQCEVLRGDVFAGRRSPVVFGEPEQWVAMVIEALKAAAEERYPQAVQLRDEAFEAAPAASGSIDGQAFEWIADADSRMGPILEAIVNGRYCWVPLHRIQDVHIEEPADLRDLVWMPAHFTWANGGESVGMIPTRYPGSESSEDDGIRMARKTEWIKRTPELFVGLGQRMFATNAGEYPLMDVRRIVLEATDAAAEAPDG